jgi:hypothetical protein
LLQSVPAPQWFSCRHGEVTSPASGCVPQRRSALDMSVRDGPADCGRLATLTGANALRLVNLKKSTTRRLDALYQLCKSWCEQAIELRFMGTGNFSAAQRDGGHQRVPAMVKAYDWRCFG